jgi:hypothetical protein
MEELLNNLIKNVKMQHNSDRQMSMGWLLVYLFPITISIIAALYIIPSSLSVFFRIDFSNPPLYNSYDWLPQEFVFLFTIVFLSGIFNLIISIVFNYLLVNRHNTHLRRQNLLSEDIKTAIDSLAKTKEKNIEDSLISLKKTLKEASYEETEKSPILWSILSAFVPFIQFYVYYFLMKDFYQHERKEDRFWTKIKEVLQKLDFNFSIPPRKKGLPHRSFVLYLILTVVTAGLFIVFWFYILLEDPNEHFKYHREVDYQLIAILKPNLI